MGNLGLRSINGVAAPPFTKGPYTWDQFVNFSGGFGGVVTDGEIRYVSQKTGKDGNDGKSWSSAKLTIQSAIDSLPGNQVGESSNLSQCDVVLVAPGKYTENVYIAGRTASGGVVTVKGHDGLKLIAVSPGWETRIRVNDAATKYALPGGGVHTDQTATGIVVMARSVEIAGFCIDGDSAAYCGIYAGDGVRPAFRTGSGGNASSLHVHDCLFQKGGYGVLLDGAGSFCLIENNIFNQLTYAGVDVCPGGGRQTERPVIKNNVFYHANAGYGVDMYNANGTVGIAVINNAFFDGTSLACAAPVRFQGTGVHIMTGNLLACTAAPTGAATDFGSGNTEMANKLDAPTYLTEA